MLIAGALPIMSYAEGNEKNNVQYDTFESSKYVISKGEIENMIAQKESGYIKSSPVINYNLDELKEKYNLTDIKTLKADELTGSLNISNNTGVITVVGDNSDNSSYINCLTINDNDSNKRCLVRFINCRFSGDFGVENLNPYIDLDFENCIFENSSTAIKNNSTSSVTVQQCAFKKVNCPISTADRTERDYMYAGNYIIRNTYFENIKSLVYNSDLFLSGKKLTLDSIGIKNCNEFGISNFFDTVEVSKIYFNDVKSIDFNFSSSKLSDIYFDNAENINFATSNTVYGLIAENCKFSSYINADIYDYCYLVNNEFSSNVFEDALISRDTDYVAYKNNIKGNFIYDNHNTEYLADSEHMESEKKNIVKHRLVSQPEINIIFDSNSGNISNVYYGPVISGNIQVSNNSGISNAITMESSSQTYSGNAVIYRNTSEGKLSAFANVGSLKNKGNVILSENTTDKIVTDSKSVSYNNINPYNSSLLENYGNIVADNNVCNSPIDLFPYNFGKIYIQDNKTKDSTTTTSFQNYGEIYATNNNTENGGIIESSGNSFSYTTGENEKFSIRNNSDGTLNIVNNNSKYGALLLGNPDKLTDKEKYNSFSNTGMIVNLGTINIEGNTGIYGGGMYLDGVYYSEYDSHVNINNNKGKYGGGIYFIGMPYDKDKHIKFNNLSVNENQADIGNGIYFAQLPEYLSDKISFSCNMLSFGENSTIDDEIYLCENKYIGCEYTAGSILDMPKMNISVGKADNGRKILEFYTVKQINNTENEIQNTKTVPLDIIEQANNSIKINNSDYAARSIILNNVSSEISEKLQREYSLTPSDFYLSKTETISFVNTNPSYAVLNTSSIKKYWLENTESIGNRLISSINSKNEFVGWSVIKNAPDCLVNDEYILNADRDITLYSQYRSDITDNYDNFDNDIEPSDKDDLLDTDEITKPLNDLESNEKLDIELPNEISENRVKKQTFQPNDKESYTNAEITYVKDKGKAAVPKTGKVGIIISFVGFILSSIGVLLCVYSLSRKGKEK